MPILYFQFPRTEGIEPFTAFTISPLTQRPRPSRPIPHRHLRQNRILQNDPDIGAPSRLAVRIRSNLVRVLPARRVIDISAEDLPARLKLGDDRLIGKGHSAVLSRPRGHHRNRRTDRIQERGSRRGHAAVVADHEDLSRKGVRTAGHEDLFNRTDGWGRGGIRSGAPGGSPTSRTRVTRAAQRRSPDRCRALFRAIKAPTRCFDA